MGYFKIFKAVRKSARDLQRAKNQRKKTNSELKIALTSLICVAVFVICWTPYAVILLVWHLPLQLSPEFKPVTISIAAVIAKTSAAFNPFIYGSLHLNKLKSFYRSLRSRNSSSKNSYVRKHHQPDKHQRRNKSENRKMSNKKLQKEKARRNQLNQTVESTNSVKMDELIL